MSQVKVAPLAEADIGTVRVLGQLLGQVSSSAASLTAERVGEVRCTPSTSVLVARLNRKIVGMALLVTMRTLARDTGYVEEVVVDQDARGQHVGTALMKGPLDLAVEKRLQFVDLTSRPSRDMANSMYQHLGFRLRQTNCYRHDLRTHAQGRVRSRLRCPAGGPTPTATAGQSGSPSTTGEAPLEIVITP